MKNEEVVDENVSALPGVKHNSHTQTNTRVFHTFACTDTAKFRITYNILFKL